ncbi:MAG: 1-acyl-sn-glycerol-3-phosphate acyltransferase [Candidatus Nanopelagicales bacterium]
MNPPPRWLRRLVLTPLLWLLLTLLTAILLPFWLVAMAIIELGIRAVARPLRLFCFGYVYIAVEAAGLLIALAQWVAALFGTRMAAHRWQRSTYRLLGGCLAVLLSAAEHLFRLRVMEDPPMAYRSGDAPVVVISRHAGPGDSFLLVNEILTGMHRRPRVVLKAALLWDPLIDVLLTRTPNVFVCADEPTAHVTARISAAAGGMGAGDALLIFPEGGNFTDARRERVIAKLAQTGHTAAAQRANDLERLLAPRVTGLQAALTACPQADVVVVAHTGLDELDSVADIWAAVPVDNTLVMSWTAFGAEAVPRATADLTDWLGYQWQLMDIWVAETSEAVAAGSAPGTRRLMPKRTRGSTAQN